jgi:DNA-binding MarR family transcriptional regulator
MGVNTSTREETQRVLDAVRRIVQALRASSSWAEKHVGMSGAQLFVLQAVAQRPAISVNDLAERTHTHQSSVSTIVGRLVDHGLVSRTRSATDGRSVEVSLTKQGQRVVGRAPDVAQERLIRGITRLSAVRRRQVAESLGEVARAVGGDERTPNMFFEDRHVRRNKVRR